MTTTPELSVQSRSAFYVDGTWVPADDREALTVVDPSTEQPVATVPAGTREDVDAAVAAARAAFIARRRDADSEAEASNRAEKIRVAT